MRCVPGKFLYMADILSRAFDQSNVPTDDDMHHGMEHFIHSVIIDLPISDVKLMELRELNCNDPTMQYALFQNGRHFSVLLFSCKLALVASFLNSKFKRIFSFKRGNKG